MPVDKRSGAANTETAGSPALSTSGSRHPQAAWGRSGGTYDYGYGRRGWCGAASQQSVDDRRGTRSGLDHGRGDSGAILGIGRSKSYQLAKADEFPVRLLRIGRRYVVPVLSILELLGAD